MAGRSTVNSYDRGGRGESGPCSSPYDVAREVEDLLAVIGAAGGSPVIVDDTHAPNDPRLPERLQAYVDEGRRGEAVTTFMRTVGAPGLMVALRPLMPVWRKLTGVAHTLPYDLSIVIEHEQGRPLPAGYYANVRPHTLVLAGGKSPEYMRNAPGRRSPRRCRRRGWRRWRGRRT